MSLIKNLNLSFKEFQLNIPELEFPDKGITLLSGPSGSGKSTLALALAGLTKTDPNFEWWFKKKT